MAIPLYLAMTAAEFSYCTVYPERPAWMSFQFSPGGRDLSNLPAGLPAGSLLILDDQIPPDGHDKGRIRQQILEYADRFQCSGVLLDFQRPDDPETAEIAATLLSLPCPVCVSDIYAKDLDCPVFVPPCPLITPLGTHLAPWDGREIWLEVALDSVIYRVTETGSEVHPFSSEMPLHLYDEGLSCRYRIDLAADHILFSLQRTRTDLDTLLASASLGITKAVGLYQELVT